MQKIVCLEGYVAYVTLFQNITCMLYKMELNLNETRFAVGFGQG